MPQFGESGDGLLTLQIDFAAHEAFEQTLVEEQERVPFRLTAPEPNDNFLSPFAGSNVTDRAV